MQTEQAFLLLLLLLLRRQLVAPGRLLLGRLGACCSCLLWQGSDHHLDDMRNKDALSEAGVGSRHISCSGNRRNVTTPI